MTKATYDYGASIHEILRVAREFGLKADHHFNMTFDDLTGYLNRNVPVIVLIQAWIDDDEGYINWNDIWEDGHYVVAIGYDNMYIYIEDPSILGGIGYIPKK
jgi:predicted double-glycine peptidase